MATTIYRKFHISCAHFLPGHPKCGQMHGHNYVIEIGVHGELHNGMVMDFGTLKDLFETYVGSRWDHKVLNDDPMLPMPTAECMLDAVEVLMHNAMRDYFPAHLLVIRIWETPDSYAERYYR